MLMFVALEMTLFFNRSIKTAKDMKQLYLAIWALLVLACGKNEKALHITLTNPSDTVRVDESFVIRREQLNIDESSELVPVLMDESNNFIPCQYDDVDGDGRWDELAFVCDLPSMVRLNLKIDWVNPKKYPVFPYRTNIRYGK